MIVLTYVSLNNPGFQKALGKLVNFVGFSPKAAYSVGRVMKTVAKETSEAQGLYQKILRKHRGESLTDEMSPDGNEAFQRDMDEFLGISFEVAVTPIPFSALDGAGLTAIEILALEPCLSGIPEIEEQKVAG